MGVLIFKAYTYYKQKTMKKLLLTMMSGLLLMSCTQQNDLTFNEMVNQTEITAKGIDTTVLFYE